MKKIKLVLIMIPTLVIVAVTGFSAETAKTLTDKEQPITIDIKVKPVYDQPQDEKPSGYLAYSDLVGKIDGTSFTITEETIGEKMYEPIIKSYELQKRAAFVTFDNKKSSQNTNFHPWGDCKLMRIGTDLKIRVFELPGMYTNEKKSFEVAFPNADYDEDDKRIVTPAHKKRVKAAIMKCSNEPFRVQNDDILVTGTITGDDSKHCETCRKTFGHESFFGDEDGAVYEDLYVTWTNDNHTVKVPFEAFCGIHIGYLNCKNPTGLLISQPNKNTVILQSLVLDFFDQDCLFVILVDRSGYTESVLIPRNYTLTRGPSKRYDRKRLLEFHN